MSRPRFSVLVPTRERPDTLRHALATCLDQEFDDYEILVTDNGTSSATESVVNDVDSGRVRYLRAPRPLAMSDNWELAVSEARGEFVFVVGDDDGLMPYALRELDALIRRLQPPAVRWEAAFYTWPDVALPGQGDYLRIPLGRGLQMVDARTAMAAIIRFELPYVRLPTFYNAAIRRDVIDDLRRRTGRVFLGRYPDVYSGFAVGHIVGRYPSVGVPMSVAGLSAHSTGVANLLCQNGWPDADFRRLNDDARLGTHPQVPDLAVFPEVPVAASFQSAREALFHDGDSLALDRRHLLVHCLAAVRPASRDQDLAAIRASVTDDPELGRWLDATVLAGVVAPRPEIRVRPDHLGFDGENLHLDAACFGVANVRDAVNLAERILCHRPERIDYDQAAKD